LLAVEKGGLYHACRGRRFLKQLRDWTEEAADLDLPADAIARFDKILPAYEKALLRKLQKGENAPTGAEVEALARIRAAAATAMPVPCTGPDLE